MMEHHEDETKLKRMYEYCPRCNATEQDFIYRAENAGVPICSICEMEATWVAFDEDREKD